MRRVAPGDQFIVMACDGLWDEMSSDQVHTTLESSLPAVALSLCGAAVLRMLLCSGCAHSQASNQFTRQKR